MKCISLGFVVIGLALGCSGTPESAEQVGVTAGSIARECFRYDSYLAALGELTAQCQGTVDPRLYHVGADGLLAPTFDSCPRDPSRLGKIKQVLSLQQRGTLAPFAKECLVERFQVAQTELAESGVTSCPTWTKARVINPVDHDTVAVVERALPDFSAGDAPLVVEAGGKTRASLTLLDAADELVAEPLNVFDLLQQNSLYRVEGQAASGEPPAARAAVCAQAFTGFVIGIKGPADVVTDPIAWLTDTTYRTSIEDPYLRPTYYHPMSYYGGVPGVVFGAPERAEPCGPNTGCLPELCSYYAGSHIKTRMQMSCVIPGDIDTCASYCGPPLQP